MQSRQKTKKGAKKNYFANIECKKQRGDWAPAGGRRRKCAMYAGVDAGVDARGAGAVNTDNTYRVYKSRVQGGTA